MFSPSFYCQNHDHGITFHHMGVVPLSLMTLLSLIYSIRKHNSWKQSVEWQKDFNLLARQNVDHEAHVEVSPIFRSVPRNELIKWVEMVRSVRPSDHPSILIFVRPSVNNSASSLGSLFETSHDTRHRAAQAFSLWFFIAQHLTQKWGKTAAFRTWYLYYQADFFEPYPVITTTLKILNFITILLWNLWIQNFCFDLSGILTVPWWAPGSQNWFHSQFSGFRIACWISSRPFIM